MWLCPKCAHAARFPDPHEPWPVGWTCAACGYAITHREGIPCLAPDLADSDAGFDPDLFEKLAQVEEQNFWFVNRARLIAHLLRLHCSACREFLEIGCGTGSVLLALRQRFAGVSLVGSELHLRGLAVARRRLGGDATLLQMDARKIPAAGQFDVIGAFDVLEHIPEDERVLAAIRDALKPAGWLIAAVPQHPWLWSPADEVAHHVRRYARGELEGKLQAAGFRVVASTSFNAVLLPLMAASRLRLRASPNPDPMSEMQIGRSLNKALGSVLALEVLLTSMGVRWPIGGSRFVVAQAR